MKTYTKSSKPCVAAIVALTTALLALTMAAPAWADPAAIDLVGPMQVVELMPQTIELEGILGYAELLEPESDEPIGDGGDWEMVPVEEVAVPAAGGDDAVEVPDEPVPDGGMDENVPEAQGDEPNEPETPDEPETADEPEQPDTPQESEETTEQAQQPGGQNKTDEPSLPFTGGNATPYAVGGLLIALSGVALLIAKRRVFAQS